MKVNIKQPNITQYHFQFEEGDPIYTNCMWARINLDHDTFTMTATSDCGDYSYRWHVTESETFSHLMARLGKDYLLDKISSRCVFIFEDSKRQLEKMQSLYDWSDTQKERLDELDECSEESFVKFAWDELNIDPHDIPVEKRYPIGAVTFCELFCKCLQPILKDSPK